MSLSNLPILRFSTIAASAIFINGSSLIKPHPGSDILTIFAHFRPPMITTEDGKLVLIDPLPIPQINRLWSLRSGEPPIGQWIKD